MIILLYGDYAHLFFVCNSALYTLLIVSKVFFAVIVKKKLYDDFKEKGSVH